MVVLWCLAGLGCRGAGGGFVAPDWPATATALKPVTPTRAATTVARTRVLRTDMGGGLWGGGGALLRRQPRRRPARTFLPHPSVRPVTLDRRRERPRDGGALLKLRGWDSNPQ